MLSQDLTPFFVDLNDPTLLKNAIKIFADKTEELRQLYIEVGELDAGNN